MGNVVIVTHWLDGDVIPFVRIGKVLKERGHKVTLITHCYFETMAREAGIDFEPWDTPEEYRELVENMNGNNTKGSFEANQEIKKEAEDFKEKYEGFETRIKEYNKILKHCKGRNTAILCKNRSSIAAYMVAEKYQLPLATVMMNPTEILSMITYDKLYAKNDMPLYNKLRKEIGLSPIKSWLQWESSSKMTLAFWPSWYDKPDTNWPSPVEAIGFPIEEGKDITTRNIPDEFRDWLNENERPLLISGGTTKLINPKFYPLSIAACQLLNKPTIVLTRYPELLPDKLPINVKWYPYLPLDEIMPYLGVLIHHGGMGTLAGALRGGTPQMILPCFVDRPYNAALIKELGVGDYLYTTKWQAENIARVINELLAPEVRERCSLYIDRMKQNNGVSIAADRVEQLMKDSKYIYTINNHYEGYDYDDDSKKQLNQNIHTVNELTLDQKRRLINRIRNGGEL